MRSLAALFTLVLLASTAWAGDCITICKPGGATKINDDCITICK